MKQNTQKPDIRAVLFDFDGTLADSLDLWGKITLNILASKGIVPDSGLFKVLDRLTLEAGIQYCIETFHLPDNPQSMISQFEQELLQGYEKDVALKEYAKDILKLCQKKQLPVCIVSASKTAWIQKTLENRSLSDCILKIYSCSDLQTDKNSPDIFLQAAAELDLAPKNVLVVEDSLFALLSAKRAGFVTAAVWEAHEKNPGQMKEQADYFWDSLQNGCRFLEEL